MSAAEGDTCARQTTGAVYCWGGNDVGQLGVGDTAIHRTPTRVGKSNSWVGVTSARTHNCARHTSGAVYCWGVNTYGQLGTGNLTNRPYPVKVG